MRNTAIAMIDYDFFTSRFGSGLIAGSGAGICELQFGDKNNDRMIRDLESRFSAAQVRHVPGRFAGVGDDMFEAYDSGIDLDLHGSDFELQVWAALRNIERGQTISYQELARCIGRPQAARAVASAVAKNRVALLVPCHRVIRADGTIGGYRWGQERKAALLQWEFGGFPTSDLIH